MMKTYMMKMSGEDLTEDQLALCDAFDIRLRCCLFVCLLRF